LSRVEKLGLASPKFIRILDPPVATTKLPNLRKKLSVLMATRWRSSQGPNFIWISRSSQRWWSSWGIRAPEARWQWIDKVLILLWQTPPSTATFSCSWSSHRDLPLCRQRPSLAISSLVSSKASMVTSSCVDDHLPLLSYLPPSRARILPRFLLMVFVSFNRLRSVSSVRRIELHITGSCI